ncbi:DUF3570 domain-containing protein [Undibacterium sp. Jales W-56]|uniref:DUF3570 domain-containing protein n=1 Tax=Undibacterium sp. Jales W-56 TaxID=2897325 RepID=UPI0021D32802|nr:DUF3570 domain-containing protein [Undibacterium sp. Jales W-56]MCU6434032.1 DUF3570 domain-containing protein [Undibacterium sp. Jales W-56]
MKLLQVVPAWVAVAAVAIDALKILLPTNRPLMPPRLPPHFPAHLPTGLPAQLASKTEPVQLTQSTLSTALLSAALILPGIRIASAEPMPEHALISLKYLKYQDSQPGLTRISVDAPSVSVLAPIAGEWSLEGTLTSDAVSGASPRYHTAISGASKMNDQRNAGDVTVTKYFPRGSLAMGVAYSTEHDYVSRAVSMLGDFSGEDKNTTWSLGFGVSKDKINPVNQIVVDEKKTTVNLLLGLTQILSTQDIGQFTLTYARGDGYFSDPYKTLDNRPRTRNQSTALVRWNHHFSGTEGTSRLSYRYYTDTYHIKAHTFTGEYLDRLGHGWTIVPSFRLYTQNAASFYFDPVYDKDYGAPFPPGYIFGGNQYLSADQRLSGFGAVTLGIKLIKQITPDWTADIKLETYEQRSNWQFFDKRGLALDPLRARSVQVGITRKW